MRKRLTSIAIIGAAGLAACFGSGPEPQKSQATVVFTAPAVEPGQNGCTSSMYISSVQIAATEGYAVLMPFYPPNSGCGGGSGGNGGMSPSVYQFDKTSDQNPQGFSLGGAGQTSQTGAPLAATGSAVYWASGSMISTQMSATNLQFNGSGSIGSFTPLALQATPANLFILAITQMFSTGGPTPYEPWNPQWPCCGNGGGGGGTSQGGLASITLPFAQPTLATPLGSGSPISPISPYCDELKRCLVMNMTELYYMRHGDSPSELAAIDRVIKPSGPVTTVETLPSNLSNASIPVGLAVTDTHIAWSIANNGTNLMSGQIQSGCWIYGRALAEQSSRPLFMTTKFSCLDVAVDDTYVYFAIVKSNVPDNGCNGGCVPPVRGLGIGRVPLDGSMTLESLALDISGPDYRGPRRVVLDQDGVSLYAIDPLAIAKLPKSALDNRQDIAP